MSDRPELTTIATRTIATAGLPARVLRSFELEVRAPGKEPVKHQLSNMETRIGSRPGNDIVLKDPAVSRYHLVIELDAHGYRLRDLESRNGTFLGATRVRDVYLQPGSVVRIGKTELRFSPLQLERQVPASHADRFGPLVGASLQMRELYAMLEKVAQSSATVLVTGETGTGKELVARAIHEASPRCGGPLVVFDCASVPDNLVESELFGHEKGAFTGATSRRIGCLEQADGGTLFLDELGELPLELQPKLLRALEQREVRRVGGSATKGVDVRLVAATNRDLVRELNQGTFRSDLYYRLAVVRVKLPALRERLGDIRLLVEHFVRAELRDDPARADAVLGGIREENWKRLEDHPWPGNVRQLRNVILRTLALSDDGDVELDTDREASASAASPVAFDLDRPFADQKREVVARFEKGYLEAQLQRHEGNFSRAAAASGLDRMYFKRLLKKHP